MMFASKFIVLSISMMSVMTDASTFLQAQPQHASKTLNGEDIQAVLIAEIESSLGTGIRSKRVNDMKAMLTPMFTSLPKNEHGNLEHDSVRYVLHRVFIQAHGWSIKGLGLDPSDSFMSVGVPAYIQNIFEERSAGRGLGLQELSVFAATVEHLIHDEAVGRLGRAFDIHQLLPTESQTIEQSHLVLDTYMMSYILGEQVANTTLKYTNAILKQMHAIYPAWNDTQKFVRQVMHQTTSAMGMTEPKLSFGMIVKVAEKVGEQFGKFQDTECKNLKTALVNMEDRGSGRVRVSDFYRGAHGGEEGGWQFQESVPYMRQLGALDESNKDEPRVMISNYLLSQTNCIASSDFYSVCCLNECEDLMGHLEKTIAGPEASAARIAQLITSLPSSSVSAPRELSATLRTRLEQIGSDHGGSVQLYSRLFAQWMHHAYPRECPFPHMSGTTTQVKAELWKDSGLATKEELKEFTKVDKLFEVEQIEDVHDLMMWSQEEELLVVRPAPAPVATAGSLGVVRGVMMCAALASVVFAMLRTVATATATGAGEVPQKYLV